MSKRKKIHDQVLNASSKEELAVAYSEWVDEYDSDVNEMGYVAHELAGKLLIRHLENKAARILDAGCGTGLVGEFLHKQGYLNIDGLDYSEHMLTKAKEKTVYQTLRQADLTSILNISDNRYDATISVGTFTTSHVGPEAFIELIRITTPGGFICFTVREETWIGGDFLNKVNELEDRDLWHRQEMGSSDYLLQEGTRCMLCLYRVSMERI